MMIPSKPEKKERPLTTREKAIVECIRQKLLASGFPPTVREICKAVGLRSTSTVHAYLSRLEEQGVIKRDPSSSRAIEIVGDLNWRNKKLVPMPVVNIIRADEPILSDEHIEDVYPMPASLIGKNDNCFIMKVRDNSMSNAGICEGDLVMVSEQNYANNGDIVVALVESDDATVKRFFKNDDGQICLQPENDAYSPVYAKEVTIRGKVIGLYRHIKYE